MITKELAEKYNIPTLEEALINWECSEEDAMIDWCKLFLSVTDHIPNKIIERLLEDLASVTVLNFIEVFIKFIINIQEEYKEVLRYRKKAREEIDKLTTVERSNLT